MKSYRDCKCPCHSGAILVHPVPCCEGIGSLFVSKKPTKPADNKPDETEPPRTSEIEVEPRRG